MKPIAAVEIPAGPPSQPPRPRHYTNRLRDEQAEATRERILDGLIRTMARGLAEVSVPAVARESGVSVPTVYRHFASKRELFAAVGPYAANKAGWGPDSMPWSLADEPAMVRLMFRRSEALDETIRAAMASQLGQEMRQQMMPQRLDASRQMVSHSLPKLASEETERFARVLLLLHSSAMLRAFKDYLGVGADEAAEDVIWATQTLLRGARLGASEEEVEP
jgi:hypothetical protein